MTALAESHVAGTAVWTADKVQKRMVDAFDVLNRLPGQGPRRSRSAWPAETVDTFAEIAQWDSGEQRKRVWEAWSHAKGVFSWEISRMDETMLWLGWLEGLERVWLPAWAAAKASHYPVRKMLDKRGLSRTTFYRTVDKAAQKLADRLNLEGVIVR